MGQEPYDGLPADVHTRGVVLYDMLHGTIGFQPLNNRGYAKPKASQQFQNLWVSMIKKFPNERPTIKQILRDLG